MAVSTSQERTVKLNPPPPASAVRERAQEYMARAGMGHEELARAVNYSSTAMRKFLSGRYEGIASTDIYIRHAMTNYIDLHALPGSDEEVPEKLIPSWDTKLMLERCEQARESGQVIILEGPPGTSKTAALGWYVRERNRLQKHDAFAVRATEQISSLDLLRRIGETVGISSWRMRGRVLRSVVRKLRECRPSVVLVDEAQRLTEHGIEPFEALRDVIDMAHCGCILAGHFNFVKSLSNGLGQQVEQWLSRIDVREHLRGLQPDELPRVAREYFGESLDQATTELIAEQAKAPDRNAFFRGRLAGGKFEPKYLNFRRVRKLFESTERLRQLPGNESASLRSLVRAAAGKMMRAL